MKLIRIGLIAVLFTAIMYGANKAIEAANGFSYKITGFGVPQYNSGIVSLPVLIRFSNPTPVSVPVDRLTVVLSYLQGNQYVKAGSIVKDSFQVNPGSNEFTVMPTIEVKQLAQNVLTTIQTVLGNKAIDVKADVTLTVKGSSVTQSFQNQISFRA